MAHSKATMDALHRAVDALKEWDMSHSTRMAYSDMAGAVLEVLSTPEFVLPLAEEMLRARRVNTVRIFKSQVDVFSVRVQTPGGQQCGPGESYGQGSTLLDAYHAATDAK